MNTFKNMLLVALLQVLAFSAEAAVSKQNRALVVVSELQTHGPNQLRELYRATERATTLSAAAVLHDDYQSIVYLSQANATLARFRNVIYNLSKRSDIKAIDVIFSLHGSNNQVAFREGAVTMSDFLSQMTTVSPLMNASQIQTMKRKLRMIYNLSCFGLSANDEFIRMGFDVTVGSRGINANAELEYPSVLTSWSFNFKFADTFRLTNTDVAIAAADTPVRMIGINADSKKFMSGRGDVTISTDPR